MGPGHGRLGGGSTQCNASAYPTDPVAPPAGIAARRPALFARRLLAALPLLAFAVLPAAPESAVHVISFLPAASDPGRRGLVRIVNHSAEGGTVVITAFDDTGRRFEGLALAIAAGAAAHFDSGDLERGNPEIGLTGSTGTGQGDWRLRLSSSLDIEPRAYASRDGFLTAMHDTAPRRGDGYRVATFNPGSNVNQESRLRLVNPGADTATVTVLSTDDSGLSPGPGVSVDLPPGGSRTFTAAELESGDAAGLTGSLGDGDGKWRLDVESTRPVRVMSLLSTPTGHLTNLSAVPSHQTDGVHRVPLFPSASDPYGRQGFVRVVNRSDAAGVVRVAALDDTEWEYEPLALSLDAGETAHFNSIDLELGNAEKGLTGSTGAGSGHWRLSLTSGLDIEVLAYIRTATGYVTAMQPTAPRQVGSEIRYGVPILQPKDAASQAGWLHLINYGNVPARVSIAARDDSGRAAPGGKVRLQLGAGAARTLTAAELADGAPGLTGAFGDGTGRWRLEVSADRPLQVMSLGHSKAGPLANLSRGRTFADDGGPDLVVESILPSDATPGAGEKLRLAAAVRNVGGEGSAGTGVRFFRSTDGAMSTGKIVLGTAAIGPLAPNGESSPSIGTTAVSGTHYYNACVDPVPEEADTRNNCSASLRVNVPLTPPAPTNPDLAVSVSVSDATPEAGQELTLEAGVRNRGGAPSDSTTLRYYRSLDADITENDTPLGTESVAALAASAGARGSVTATAPRFLGKYHYGACVDTVPDETVIANNCAGVQVNVTGPAPDLVVENASVDPVAIGHDEPFRLQVTVRNAGDAESFPTRLRYFRSEDPTISTADAEMYAEGVASLPASQSTGKRKWFLSPWLAGRYHFGACVDPVFEESDEGNNCSKAVALTVTSTGLPPAPDLVLNHFRLDKYRLSPGEVFVGHTRLRNEGDAVAPATNLRYYLSTDATVAENDRELGQSRVPSVDVGSEYAEGRYLDAPLNPGTYWFAVCADIVAGERVTANNCSHALETVVE